MRRWDAKDVAVGSGLSEWAAEDRRWALRAELSVWRGKVR